VRPEELHPRQTRDAATDDDLRAIIERDFAVIGRGHGQVDGLDKASGRKVYTDDIALPAMLHGKILRSTEAHARILSIDTTRARTLPGVHAVITGASMPTPYCVIPWTRDETALCVDRVRFIGDGVAAVAAEDEDTANAALELIDVVYEPLTPFFDPEDALAPGDALTIHEAKKPGHNGNVTKIVRLEFGDVDALMDGSDIVVEGEYYFEGTTHTPIEPHCAIGYYDPSGKLTVWSATQVPHYLHRELARVLDLDVARIRVVQPAVGGAFGGKSEPFDLEFCVAKLSQITGRPVKILYTREEVFYSHRGRHPMRMRYRLGAAADGKIRAVDNRTLIDGGAYASFGLVTTYYSGQLLPPPYEFPSYRFDSTRVYTNKPPCGPKRGHGSVQPRFAFEVQLDRLSEALGIDPIELRRRNFLGADTRTVNELRVRSNGFLDCLSEVERASGWASKWRRMAYGRGVGVAGSSYISGTNYPIYPNDMPQAAVSVQVERSGRVAVFSGASEIGQGSDSMVAYVVAEELGVPLSYVRVVSADTDLVPVDLGAYSSRETFMVGNACLQAARALREKVVDAVSEAWSEGWAGESEHAREGEGPAFPRKRVALAGGWAFDVCDTARKMPIAEAFNLAEARYGTLGAVGHYDTPKEGVHGDYRGGTIGASPAYSFTAHVAEVSVDPETGVVQVEKIWIAHDCGRALNPVLVAGQMEGSAYMGAAEAIMEEQVFKGADEGKAGLHDAPSLLDYRIPTSLDTPEMESLIVESVDPDGPYGAKEAGEGPLHPSIPAIANAIFDAVGVRMDELPFNPPRVWAALRDAGEAARARWRACRGGMAPDESPPGVLVRTPAGRV
jgi:4-hydroxybenzoyl-CoA reductase alpha subunit